MNIVVNAKEFPLMYADTFAIEGDLYIKASIQTADLATESETRGIIFKIPKDMISELLTTLKEGEPYPVLSMEVKRDDD